MQSVDLWMYTAYLFLKVWMLKCSGIPIEYRYKATQVLLGIKSDTIIDA